MKILLFGFVVLFCSTMIHADIYALKGGVLAHSEGPVSSGKEQGYDLNIEVLLEDDYLQANWAFGADINNQSDTSFIYSGLNWEGLFFETFIWEFFLGIATHDGEISTTDTTKRAFGSRVLFREAVAIGIELSESITVTFIYDHYSHTGIDDRINQGNDNSGIRLAYYF